MLFSEFPLSDRVQSALAKKGFEEPTPIQAESIPFTLDHRDVLGQARTGTGKTLAFGLPIANHLEPDKSRGRTPRAFVVTPTRELALQVASELEWLAPHLNVVTVYGGTGYGKQAGDLKRGADVVVATPGRAIDYLGRGILDLSQVEIVVLDEADEMLSMGFEKDVETLLSETPRERQTLLFSATLPKWARKLAKDHLTHPEHIDVMGEESISYEEVAIEAPLRARMGILSDLLHLHHGDKAIIFTHTKAEVDKLAKELSLNGHAAEAIHGDLNQTQRERVLGRFRSGQVNALIGTNVAARGLDIPEVDLVVHYRVETEMDAYQHRSGRTGRAGRTGKVILLHGPKERREVQKLERALRRTFERGQAPSADTIQEAKLKSLLGNAKSQSKKDKTEWQHVAKNIIAENDADTLAGLFALVLGSAPAPRSLLTGDEGWTTLELKGDYSNPGQVMRVLKDAGANDVGRILVGRVGAYADVTSDDAQKLIEEKTAVKAQSVPVEMPSGRDRGSRRSGGRDKRRRSQRPQRGNRSSRNR